MKIALTGGPACGKSTVAAFLREKTPDYSFISYETLCRDLFKEPEFLVELQSITGVHSYDELVPHLWTDARTRAWFNVSASRWIYPVLTELLAKHARIVVEVPRLLENKGMYELFDYVVAAVCDIPTQHDRLIEQTGLDLFVIEECLVNDFSSHLNAAVADYVVDTSLGGEDLKEQLTGVACDIAMRSLRFRAERFFGTPEVWAVIEPNLPTYGGLYPAAACLAQFFSLFDKHRNVVLDPTALEFALWFYYSGYTDSDLPSFQHWRQTSVRTMWQVVKRLAPKFLQVPHSLALASEMILATNLFTAKTRGSLAKLNWQRDIGFFLDLFPSFWGAIPEADAIQLAKGIEAMFLPLAKSTDQNLTYGLFSRYVRMSGSFHHPEMSFNYKAPFEHNFRTVAKHLALDLDTPPEEKLLSPVELIRSLELRRG